MLSESVLWSYSDEMLTCQYISWERRENNEWAGTMCVRPEFKLLIDINCDYIVPQISLFFAAEVYKHDLHLIT